MKPQRFSLLALFATVVLPRACTAWAQEPVASATPAAAKKPLIAYPERTETWEKAIKSFEAKDKAGNAPAPGSIVFVGSSSIVKWTTLAKDFPGLPVINRGFGGSMILDSTYYADRIVIPYQPRTVVFYAGDNDIGARHTQEQVVGDFQTFAMKVRASLPGTKIVFLAIKPSLSRWKYQNEIVAANQSIAAWMGRQKNMAYVDVHTPMLGTDGKPRPELYQPDGLHMTPAGYKLWTRIVAPYLK